MASEDVPDPFTLGYRAILAALQNSDIFNRTVQAGNIVGGELGETDPQYVQQKPTVQPGDLPEVDLLQTGFGIEPQAVNSVSAGWHQDYPLVVTGDSPGPTDVNRVKWAIFCALSHAGDDLGLPFCRGWKIVENATDRPAATDPEKERGTKRYVSVLAVRLTCYWPKKNLPT